MPLVSPFVCARLLLNRSKLSLRGTPHKDREKGPSPSAPRRGADDGDADLTYVYSAAREIAAALSGFTVVIIKSTVPVGTGDEVERLIRADAVVASNPEFLREGAAIRDFKFLDRVVVGTSDERGRKVLGDIYRPLSLNQAPLMFAARRTAEFIKYGANAFLATNITFINEMADLSEKVGADAQEVRAASGSTTASARNSCMPDRVLAVPVFQRIPARWSRSRSITMCSCGSSRQCWASTTTASARWHEKLPTRLAAACAARPSPYSALPSSRIPMT